MLSVCFMRNISKNYCYLCLQENFRHVTKMLMILSLVMCLKSDLISHMVVIYLWIIFYLAVNSSVFWAHN